MLRRKSSFSSMAERIVVNTGPLIALALALEQGIERVCIDEWKGRRAAAAGLQVTGVLGLLGRAKMLGLLPALRPLVERAVERGIRYHPKLVHKVLSAVGE